MDNLNTPLLPNDRDFQMYIRGTLKSGGILEGYFGEKFLNFSQTSAKKCKNLNFDKNLNFEKF